MAVAVKKEAEAGVAMPALGLAGASLLGAVYVFLGFVAVYHGLPQLYDLLLADTLGNVPFVFTGLKLLVMAGGAVGLVLLWSRLTKPVTGVRAGITTATVMLLAGLLVVLLATRLVVSLALKNADPTTLFWGGLATSLVVGALWAFLMVRTFNKPRFQAALLDFEAQGWFTYKSYKKGQGLRVRRGTMLGALLIAGAGIWAYFLSRGLQISAPPWVVDVPFDATREIPLLYTPEITIAVLLAALALWGSYRIVNYPRFADFLIATDAELNKVSWSTRKRLFQDTTVVMITVILLAVFLLLIDLLWTFVLTRLGVIVSS